MNLMNSFLKNKTGIKVESSEGREEESPKVVSGSSWGPLKSVINKSNSSSGSKHGSNLQAGPDLGNEFEGACAWRGGTYCRGSKRFYPQNENIFESKLCFLQ